MSKKETKKAESQKANEVIDLLVQAGYLADKTINDEDVRIAKANRQQHLYHNTKLLLKHYRDIIWILESFPDEVSDELQEPVKDLDKIIERISHEIDIDSNGYMEKLRSINKSRSLVELVHRSMMILKSKPDGGERMYNAIYLTYFYKDKLTTQEILIKMRELDKNHEIISERAYYYIRNKAINILSLCLWSSPNKALDSWINLAILLKEINKKRE